MTEKQYIPRVFAGLICIVGLILLLVYWPRLAVLSMDSLLGVCYSIAILGSLVGNLFYCVAGRWWYLAVTSIVFLLALKLGDGFIW